MGLAAEGGGKPPALHRHGIAALIVQNFNGLRNKQILIIPRCQCPAFLHLEKRTFPTALAPAADTHSDSGDYSISACWISAAFSKGGSSLPRRSARLKIPAQAFGDKEYFAGASASKICDKKQAPPPLGSPKVLGIVDAPSEINASASRHSGVGPSSRLRHWNFGACERRKHGLIVTPSIG